ncbi:MAG: NmrA family NAD(P)-binding protein [Thermoanaerobaculia bacterium]|nr:NmrA family NAD(P)-binding protein [Thermoanaerobaculia bacterium]
MRVMVTGGTGTVGSAVVGELVSRGVSVRVLTRSAERAAALPAGVEGVVGDLLDPDTVRTAFAGADGLFLLNAVSTTEAHEGIMGVHGARLGRVGRIVYLSVQEAERAPHLPHFGAKLAVEAAVVASGIPFTILRPNNFFQNDLWFRQALVEHGLYPQPIGAAGISRVDVRDIAEAAAIALTGEGHAGETYELVGPEALTGERCAAIWSAALGRPVAYGGDDLDAWEAGARQYLPAWMAFDFRQMYGHFQTVGLAGSAAAVARQTALLGHLPRPLAAFAAECAATWRDSAGI